MKIINKYSKEISRRKILSSVHIAQLNECREALGTALSSIMFKLLCDLLCFPALNSMKICLLKSKWCLKCGINVKMLNLNDKVETSGLLKGGCIFFYQHTIVVLEEHCNIYKSAHNIFQLYSPSFPPSQNSFNWSHVPFPYISIIFPQSKGSILQRNLSNVTEIRIKHAQH